MARSGLEFPGTGGEERPMAIIDDFLMTDNRTIKKQCEYCNNNRKPIETEIDDEARIILTPDDYEYPEGFLLDVYKKLDDMPDDVWGRLMYSFIVPCCPMCGRRLKASDDND